MNSFVKNLLLKEVCQKCDKGNTQKRIILNRTAYRCRLSIFWRIIIISASQVLSNRYELVAVVVGENEILLKLFHDFIWETKGMYQSHRTNCPIRKDLAKQRSYNLRHEKSFPFGFYV